MHSDMTGLALNSKVPTTGFCVTVMTATATVYKLLQPLARLCFTGAEVLKVCLLSLLSKYFFFFLTVFPQFHPKCFQLTSPHENAFASRQIHCKACANPSFIPVKSVECFASRKKDILKSTTDVCFMGFFILVKINK